MGIARKGWTPPAILGICRALLRMNLDILKMRQKGVKKARYNFLCKDQEKMIINLARSSSCIRTASGTQHQEARKKRRKGKSAESSKPKCSKPRAHWHHSQNSGNAVKSASTTSSGPRINVRPECHTLHEAQSELIESETSRTTDNIDESRMSSSPRYDPAPSH